MIEYFTTDNIAIYGAIIIATLALLTSFFQYLHNRKDKMVQLEVSCKKHPNYRINIDNRNIPYDPYTGDGASSGEIYIINVQNIGNVDAFIENIYAVSEDGVQHDVLVSSDFGHSKVLAKIYQSNKEIIINAKSSQNFSLYLGKNDVEYKIKSCFAVDKTNKKWKAKLK